MKLIKGTVYVRNDEWKGNPRTHQLVRILSLTPLQIQWFGKPNGSSIADTPYTWEGATSEEIEEWLSALKLQPDKLTVLNEFYNEV